MISNPTSPPVCKIVLLVKCRNINRTAEIRPDSSVKRSDICRIDAAAGFFSIVGGVG